MSGIGAAVGLSAAQEGIRATHQIGINFLNYYLTKKIADYQNDLAISNWEMQNEYNLPKNQMQRFMDAGLNPNLMYGQGTPGNASSAPDAHHVGKLYIDYQMENVLGLALENQLKAQQIRNNKQTEHLSRMRSIQENIKANIAEQEYNALQLFMSDKLGTTPNYVSFFGNGGRVEQGSPDGEDIDLIKLRNSPMYYSLQQRWNNKELTREKLVQMGLQTKNVQSLFNTLHGNLGSAEDLFYTFFKLLLGYTMHGNMSTNY